VRADLDEWFKVEVWAGFSFDSPVMIARLDAALATFRPAVCYLDVLRKMTSADLNKQVESSPLLKVLDDLRRKHGTVFRVIHHYRKLQGGFRSGRGSQEISGSFVLGAWAEQSLFFEPIGRKQGAVMVNVQSKDAPPVPGFQLKIGSEGPEHAPTVLRLVAEEPDDSPEADDKVFHMLATLAESPDMLTEAKRGAAGVAAKTIAPKLGKSTRTVNRALERLCSEERVVLTGTTVHKAKLYRVRAS
jgi:hypothetical protein